MQSFEIQVVDVEPHGLGDPCSAAVQQLQQRAVGEGAAVELVAPLERLRVLHEEAAARQERAVGVDAEALDDQVDVGLRVVGERSARAGRGPVTAPVDAARIALEDCALANDEELATMAAAGVAELVAPNVPVHLRDELVSYTLVAAGRLDRLTMPVLLLHGSRTHPFYTDVVRHLEQTECIGNLVRLALQPRGQNDRGLLRDHRCCRLLGVDAMLVDAIAQMVDVALARDC